MTRPVRILLRLVLVWLVVMPVSFYFGYPYLVAELEGKVKAQSIAQCRTETAAHPETFDPAQPAITQNYCSCIADGIKLSLDDLIAIAKRQPPAAMQAGLDQRVTQCTDRLMNPEKQDAQIIHF